MYEILSIFGVLGTSTVFDWSRPEDSGDADNLLRICRDLFGVDENRF